ncbi:hypothetical protein EMN47_17520 [Prolixibacteraceae bacterium JC049]|nr:hypothetical protein [Prolixibacteraceae bacterium JC049]
MIKSKQIPVTDEKINQTIFSYNNFINVGNNKTSPFYQIYAIIPTPNSLNHLSALLNSIKGIHQSSLLALPLNRVTVILEATNNKTVSFSKKNLIHYLETIENLFAHYSLLPFRFGMVLSPLTLIDLIRSKESELIQNLTFISQKTEFGLKVFWQSPEIRDKQITARMSKNSFFLTSSKNLTTSQQYLIKKVHKHRYIAYREAICEEVAAKIEHSISKLNVIVKHEKNCSDNLLLETYFLLNGKQSDKLRQIILELGNKEKDLQLILTGPWPPFNFINVTLK